MPHPNEILFSVNEYDKNGDLTEMGVYLHFGDTKVKVADSKVDFCENIVHCMKEMVTEIDDNY
jgi:hypothetical protein